MGRPPKNGIKRKKALEKTKQQSTAATGTSTTTTTKFDAAPTSPEKQSQQLNEQFEFQPCPNNGSMANTEQQVPAPQTDSGVSMDDELFDAFASEFDTTMMDHEIQDGSHISNPPAGHPSANWQNLSPSHIHTSMQLSQSVPSYVGSMLGSHGSFLTSLMPPPNNNASQLDICHQFSNLLFSLHLANNNARLNAEADKTKEGTTRRWQEISQSGSRLCDIVQTVLSNTRETNGSSPENPDWQSHHALLQLALTATAMLLDSYHTLLVTHLSIARTLSQCMDLGPAHRESHNQDSTSSTMRNFSLNNHNNNKGSQLFPSEPHGGGVEKNGMFSSAPQSTTAYYLTSIVQLTTMDFHLTKLGYMFRFLKNELVSCNGSGEEHGKNNGGGGVDEHGEMLSREIGSLLQEIKRMKDDMRYAIEVLHIRS